MVKIKKEGKITKEILKEAPIGENPIEVLRESVEAVEKKETLSNKEMQKLKERIEKMDLGDDLKQQAEVEAQKIKFLEEEEKIKNLLQIAKNRDVIFAVGVAKKMDPYILDRLHDTLAEKGYYKKFMK